MAALESWIFSDSNSQPLFSLLTPDEAAAATRRVVDDFDGTRR